jgi:hypothetical protein
MSATLPREERFGLTSQIRRAATSSRQISRKGSAGGMPQWQQVRADSQSPFCQNHLNQFALEALCVPDIWYLTSLFVYYNQSALEAIRVPDIW